MSERKAPLRVTRELARWRRLAAQGDPRGQVNLGLHYALGEGVRADRRRANRLYRLAAAQGNAVAMHNLGVVYANGRGVRRDDSKAYDWYLRAARLGHRDACYRALDLIEEERVQHRLRAALACLRSIAAAGDVDAQVTYGVHCFEGNGVRRDWPQALHWYGLAAAAGDTHALFNLGHMHRNGHGVPADRDAAMSFYRRAAARGHARSAEWLARCHEGTRREFVWWRRHGCDVEPRSALSPWHRLPHRLAEVCGAAASGCQQGRPRLRVLPGAVPGDRNRGAAQPARCSRSLRQGRSRLLRRCGAR
jgi:TPR repeat protein